MSCYSYQTMHFKHGALDVDAVYVLTMENSSRIDGLKSQLYHHKPGANIIIQINKGFRACRKRLCGNSKTDIDISVEDISHAYLNAFQHALDNGYKNVLILEDDAVFSDLYFTTENIDVVNDFIPKLQKNGFVFALGVLPWASLYHSNGIRRSLLSTGTHATIFPQRIMEEILLDCNSIHDIDLYINFHCTRYFHSLPLVSQTFAATENRANWGDNFGIFGAIARYFIGIVIWCLGLEDKVEPGTTIIYTINKIIFDLGIPLLIIGLLYLNMPK